MTITTIRDTLRAFAQSLQVSFSFPAALFVIMNLYFVIPAFFAVDLDALATFSMTIAAALLLSYLLFAFNYPLIRLLEGHKLRECDWNKWLATVQRRAYEQAWRDLKHAEEWHRYYDDLLPFDPTSAPETWRKLNLSEEDQKNYSSWLSYSHTCTLIRSRLEQTFPTNPDSILATSLGNSIAAFEDYPRSRYGMDSVALWPRMLPILRDKKYHEFVFQEKMTFDFLLNMLLVTLALGIEFFYLFVFIGRVDWAAWAFGLTVALLWIMYEGLVVAARQWGTSVRVAFDLFRQDLLHALRVRPVSSPEDEFTRWQEVSLFFALRQKRYERDSLLYVDEVVPDQSP